MKTTLFPFVAVMAATVCCIAAQDMCPSDPLGIEALPQDAALCIVTKCAQDCQSPDTGMDGVLDFEEALCPIINCCEDCSDAVRKLYSCTEAGQSYKALCEQAPRGVTVTGCELECSIDRFPFGVPVGRGEDSERGSQIETSGGASLGGDGCRTDAMANCFLQNPNSCGSCAPNSVDRFDMTNITEGGAIDLEEVLCPSITCCDECASEVQAYYRCTFSGLEFVPDVTGIDLQCEGVASIPSPSHPGTGLQDVPCIDETFTLFGCLGGANCITCFPDGDDDGNDDGGMGSFSCTEAQSFYNAINACCPKCDSELNDAIRCQFGDGQQQEDCPFVHNIGGDSLVSIPPPSTPGIGDSTNDDPCSIEDTAFLDCVVGANCFTCLTQSQQARPPSCAEFEFIYTTTNECCPGCESELREAAYCLLTEGELKQRACPLALSLAPTIQSPVHTSEDNSSTVEAIESPNSGTSDTAEDDSSIVEDDTSSFSCTSPIIVLVVLTVLSVAANV